MPKIMYRPNPVPPPFVPPTPSYDTTSTIKFSKFPFESSEDVGFELPSLNVPNYSYFYILQFNPDSDNYVSLSDEKEEQVSQPISSSFTAERDSFANDDFELRFYSVNHDLVWTIKATRID